MADIDWDGVIADIQRPKGWIKGAFFDERGGHCLIGALRTAHPAANVWLSACDTLQGIASEQFPEREVLHLYPHPIVSFNDHPDTTKGDVILVLEKARANG